MLFLLAVIKAATSVNLDLRFATPGSAFRAVFTGAPDTDISVAIDQRAPDGSLVHIEVHSHADVAPVELIRPAYLNGYEVQEYRRPRLDILI